MKLDKLLLNDFNIDPLVFTIIADFAVLADSSSGRKFVLIVWSLNSAVAADIAVTDIATS